MNSTSPPTKRKRNSGTSLLARGEPVIWFTGTSLAMCLVMIVGLLGIILYQGAVTFWPKKLTHYQITSASGTIVDAIGQAFSSETYALKREMYRAMSKPQRDYLRGAFLLEYSQYQHLSGLKFTTDRPLSELLDKPKLDELQSAGQINSEATTFDLPQWQQLSSGVRYQISPEIKWSFSDYALPKKSLPELSKQITEKLNGHISDPGKAFDHLLVNEAGVTSLDAESLAALKTHLKMDPKDALDALLPYAAEINSTRTLVRVGNLEINENRFKWVNELDIVNQFDDESFISIERYVNGPFFGELIGAGTIALSDEDAKTKGMEPHLRKSNVNDISVIPSDEATGKDVALIEYHSELQSSWSYYQSSKERIYDLRREKLKLEEDEKGHILYLVDSARRKTSIAARDYGKSSNQFKSAIKAYEDIKQEKQPEIDRINKRVNEINTLLAQKGLLVKTADGKTSWIPLTDITRAYLPNMQSYSEQLGTYFSRWHEFLFDWPRESNTEGGVWPAIVGTVLMTLLMTFAVVPFGVLAALYLKEYAKSGPLISAVRIAVNNLAGVPSIVFGMFGLAFFCYNVGKYIDGGPKNMGVEPFPAVTWIIGFALLLVITFAAIYIAYKTTSQKDTNYPGWLSPLLWIITCSALLILMIRTPFFGGFFSEALNDNEPTFGTGGVLWSSLTLALLTLPVVIVATEEALAAVPSSMREGSYACGASKWQTIQRIVLPRSAPGIMTGAILAMARGAGEVAPLMLVGAIKSVQNMPGGIDNEAPYVHIERSFMHLGFHIYDLGFQSTDSDASRPLVFTTTLLLVSLIAILNLSAIWLRARLRKKFEGGKF